MGIWNKLFPKDPRKSNGASTASVPTAACDRPVPGISSGAAPRRTAREEEILKRLKEEEKKRIAEIKKSDNYTPEYSENWARFYLRSEFLAEVLREFSEHERSVYLQEFWDLARRDLTSPALGWSHMALLFDEPGSVYEMIALHSTVPLDVLDLADRAAASWDSLQRLYKDIPGDHRFYSGQVLRNIRKTLAYLRKETMKATRARGGA